MQDGEQQQIQHFSHSVAETILMQLQQWGVKRIYGVIGDAIFGLMDAIAKQKEIKFISVKHESVAAMMASAEAKLTGNIGVCIAQMGPGLANLINGIGDAYLDKAPILAITGQAPLKKIGTPYKQYINQQKLMQGITGFSELIVHPDALVVTLAKAIHTAVSMETVAHLSIPTNLFDQITYEIPYKKVHKKEVQYCTDQLNDVIEVMQGAGSPMILVGNNARGIQQEIRTLAETWGSGLVTAYGAIGVFPKSCQYYLGGLGEGGNKITASLFKQSDVILAIDTSWWPEGFTPTKATVIQIQNNEIKIGEGMPTDYSIVGLSSDIIPYLNMNLQLHQRNKGWIQQVYHTHLNWNKIDIDSSSSPLVPASIISIIEKNVTIDTIIALDEGDSTLWFMEHFKGQCSSVLLSSNWRTMGFGLPAALTAKLVMPDKHVICITGDGGLAMVLADLLTATRYKLNITVLVFNNGTLQMERNKMTLKGLVTEGTDITNPDFTALAIACGWKAYSIQTNDELEQILKTTKNSENPILLNVKTAQDMYPNYQSQ